MNVKQNSATNTSDQKKMSAAAATTTNNKQQTTHGKLTRIFTVKIAKQAQQMTVIDAIVIIVIAKA